MASMARGEGRRTILTLPVFGFFGSLLAPVDLEFVDGVAVLGGWTSCSPMEARFRPYFKTSSKLRMSNYESLVDGRVRVKFSRFINGSLPESVRSADLISILTQVLF